MSKMIAANGQTYIKKWGKWYWLKTPWEMVEIIVAKKAKVVAYKDAVRRVRRKHDKES